MRHTSGLANWSIHHPVGVVMIALAVMVLGSFALNRLAVDLLPHIIYPEIRVRIIDSGVPPPVMEDRVTRQLEEQLAITEDATHVQSTTTQGTTTVDLAFEYGKDIDEVNGVPAKHKAFNKQSVVIAEKNIPTYTKTEKSQVVYAAGYYGLKFPEAGWKNAYCVKLETLYNYVFIGPFKSKTQLEAEIHRANI